MVFGYIVSFDSQTFPLPCVSRILTWWKPRSGFSQKSATISRYNQFGSTFLFYFTRSWQGIQVTSDNGLFGGFTHSLLTAFRDEFPRLPSLTFSFCSDANPDNVRALVVHIEIWIHGDSPQDIGLRTIMNDALCLQSLMELSTLNVPIQTPPSWSQGLGSDNPRLNVRGTYKPLQYL